LPRFSLISILFSPLHNTFSARFKFLTRHIYCSLHFYFIKWHSQNSSHTYILRWLVSRVLCVIRNYWNMLFCKFYEHHSLPVCIIFSSSFFVSSTPISTN
jgi:hypothetical protein